MFYVAAAAVVLAVAGSGETVLLSFHAEGCVPCRQMQPTIAQLAQEGHPVRRIDVTRESATAQRFGIRAVPAFVMLVGGREVDRVEGPASFQRLQRMLRSGRPDGGAAANLDRADPPEGAGLGASATSSAPPPAAGHSLPPIVGEETPMRSATDRAGPARLPDAPAEGTAQGAGPAPDGRPPSRTAAVGDGDLIAATVRLRIEDPTGRSFGTGTIIDTRQGEALILTCGHIFRDSRGKGDIEVDLFGPTPTERLPARLVAFDIEADVGLLTIRAPGPLRVARLAPRDRVVQPGERIMSVGCDNGDDPTVHHGRVVTVDRYLGPPNLQVTGLPVVGRSGGGLFSKQGKVIGVCNAADPKDNEGLYAALGAIYDLVDRAQLSALLETPGEGRLVGDPEPESLATTAPPEMPSEMPAPRSLGGLAAVPISHSRGSHGPPTERHSDGEGINPGERALLEDIGRRRAEGAEVICIFRNPGAKSEIFILNEASPDFFDRLARAARIQRPSTEPTSLEVPSRRGDPSAPRRFTVR